MAFNYLSNDGLLYLWGKITALFVRKELRTGSQSQYKTLTDNNLTDALVEKINKAGTSSFSGAYSALTGKPSIEGHEVASGANTAASLGLATPSDVSAAVAEGTQGMATQSWVTGKGYQTSAQVSQAISTATSGMATQSWVTGKGYQTSAQVSSAISAAVSSAFTYKGSKSTVSALPSSGNKVGDVWHVVADAGEYAWDGSKWEPLGGNMDLSAYLLKSDMVAITNAEIDEIVGSA